MSISTTHPSNEQPQRKRPVLYDVLASVSSAGVTIREHLRKVASRDKGPQGKLLRQIADAVGTHASILGNLVKSEDRNARALAAYRERQCVQGMKKREAAEKKLPLPEPPPVDRLVAALEGLIADHRAGIDVWNRVVNTEFPDEGPDTLRYLLTSALFGKSALPRRPNGCTLYCTPKMHASLRRIGDGSPESGLVVIVRAAVAWLKRDRADMLKWATRQPLEFLSPDRTYESGLFGEEIWDIPVRCKNWYSDLSAVAEEIGRARKDDVLADAILQAMITSWSSAAFRARVLGSGAAFENRHHADTRKHAA